MLHSAMTESPGSPNRSVMKLRPMRARNVTAAAATKATAIPAARARLRRITQMKSTSSWTVPAMLRTAVRSDPIAPSAAPTSATSEKIPVTVKPTGSIDVGSFTMPSSPTSPGIAESIAATIGFHASGLPASQIEATENPSSRPANTLNRAR